MASIASVVSARSAQAAPAQRIDLRWTSDAPTCIDEATLAKTVEVTLGRPVFHADAPASASIAGTIGRASAGRGFRAKITMRAPSGEIVSERELSTSSSSCDRMDESVAIVVALMADDLQEPTADLTVPEALPRAPAPPPAIPSRDVRERVTPERAAPSPRAASSSSVEAEAGGAVAAGLLPTPGPGTYLRAELGVGRAGVAVSAHGFLPSKTRADGPGGVISAWAFDSSACYAALERPSLRVGGCVLVGGGWTDATPIGTGDSQSQRLPFAFVGLSLEASVRIEGLLWLHVRPSAWSPVASAEYFFQGRDGAQHTVFEQWVVAPSVSVGIGARSGS